MPASTRVYNYKVVDANHAKMIITVIVFWSLLFLSDNLIAFTIGIPVGLALLYYEFFGREIQLNEEELIVLKRRPWGNSRAKFKIANIRSVAVEAALPWKIFADETYLNIHFKDGTNKKQSVGNIDIKALDIFQKDLAQYVEIFTFKTDFL